MNNKIYLYNNTLISLLCLIKKLLDNRIVPNNIKNIDYSPTLFDEIIELDIQEDEKIINDIIKFLNPQIFSIIYYVFISNNENKDIIIYYFLVHSIKYKNKVFYQRNLKSVDRALKISKYVSNENHRLKGFLRFKEIKNNILYAEIAPENNIIVLLSRHFMKRLKNEYWIIKDTKRKTLSIYDKKNFYLVNEGNFKMINNELSDDEIKIEDMWKSFYKTIGITERKNERCRMNFMPKKYWPYIIEMSDDNEKNNNI